MKCKLRLISLPFRKSGLTIGKIYDAVVYEEYPGSIIGFFDDDYNHRMIPLEHFEFVD